MGMADSVPGGRRRGGYKRVNFMGVHPSVFRNRSAYLVAALKPDGWELDVFSEATPTVRGGFVTALIHEIEGDDFASARREMLRWVAMQPDWFKARLRPSPKMPRMLGTMPARRAK